MQYYNESSAATYTIRTKGRVYWSLVFEYDNSTNSGTIEAIAKLERRTTYRSREFLKEFNSTTEKWLEDNKISAEVGAAYESVSAKVSTDIEFSHELNQVLETTRETSAETDSQTTTSEEKKYVVGPFSKLSLFQRVFVTSGIQHDSNVYSTDLKREFDDKEVTIEHQARPIRFVKGFKVSYGDQPSDAPADRVRAQRSDLSDDINKGFGGKYVWIAPEHSYNGQNLAASMFDLYIQPNPVDGWYDLAKGAGGDYRYLKAVQTHDKESKIIELGFLRSSEPVSSLDPQSGFTGMTGDINGGRGGDYLYLIWKTRRVFKSDAEIQALQFKGTFIPPRHATHTK